MKEANMKRFTLHNTIIDLRLHIYKFAAEEKDTYNGQWIVAAKLGDLEALQALEEHVQSRIQKWKQENPRQFVREALNALGKLVHSPSLSRNLTIESSLVENQCKVPQICENLARGGHLQGLKWARSKHCPWDALTFASAVTGGHWHVIQWLQQEQCPWDTSACTAAATMGHWHILKWLKLQQCPWDRHTFAAAVQQGDLNILIWMRQEGCPFDETACESAARLGRLDLLKWLRSESCPWGLYTAVAAAEGGHLELLLWLREEGCPYNELVVYRAAARGGHFKMLQTLKQEIFHVPAYNIRVWKG